MNNELQAAPTTVYDLIKGHADRSPTSNALLGMKQVEITYQHLHDHVQATVATLHELGLTSNARVALVMAQGPEFAVALLSVASCSTCIPLNPAYHDDEFKSYFSRLKVSFLIVQAGLDTPARQGAQDLGISIIELLLTPGPRLFVLAGKTQSGGAAVGYASSDDLALILHTSGSTGRPKLIAQTQRMTVTGSITIAKIMELGPQDRGLNLMPMVHALGMQEALRILAVGGSVICIPGFDAARFFEWLREFQPTLCSATSSMFRTILTYADINQDVLQQSSLRFLRSGTMSMPPQLMEELEAVFHVPVIQSYGSTETGLVAINPRPPRPRKSGSVGVVVDGEVHIVSPAGQTVRPGETGEIFARGPRVIRQYEDDPGLTDATFLDGWYKTGDQGYLDDDGYLFITGRSKEIINRGGVKISPLEIESVLNTHPAVAEVVAFGLPDPHLGEEIAVAVVLKENTSVTDRDIQQFAMTRLADNKIPRRVIRVASLPRTDLGKLQRVGLADRLGIMASLFKSAEGLSNAGDHSSRSTLEKQLISHWAELLKRDPSAISVNEHFRDLGGDSLAATHLVFRVRESMHVMVSIVDFFDAPTIAQQADVLDRLLKAGDSSLRTTTLVPIRPGGTHYPLFCFHALEGGVYIYKDFAEMLDPEQPIYGLQAVGMDGTEPPLERVEDMVSHHFRELQSVQTRGPYFLCGYSFGGRVALETARQLRDVAGQEAFVFIIDDHFQRNSLEMRHHQTTVSVIAKFTRRARSFHFALARLPGHYQKLYLRQKFESIWQADRTAPQRRILAQQQIEQEEAALPPSVFQVKQASKRASLSYVPQAYTGPLTYLRASEDHVNIPFFRTWETIAQGPAELIDVPGTHKSIMKDPAIRTVARELQRWLDRPIDSIEKQT